MIVAAAASATAAASAIVTVAIGVIEETAAIFAGIATAARRRAMKRPWKTRRRSEHHEPGTHPDPPSVLPPPQVLPLHRRQRAEDRLQRRAPPAALRIRAR